jgi:transcriptional regulator with XRE-family HTH domain
VAVAGRREVPVGGGLAEVTGGRDQQLGERIRSLREARQVSGIELARLSRVTPGAISQIERGRVQPSLSTLRAIADALGEPIFRFFVSGSEDASTVVRRDERKRLKLPHSPVEFELLSPALNRRMEVLEVKLQPGSATAAEALPHAGEEEFMLIVKGRGRLEIGGTSFELAPGDSATYVPSQPHRLVNVGRTELVQISAITPPAF